MARRAMPTITGLVSLSNREGRSARRTVPSRDLAPKSRHRSIALAEHVPAFAGKERPRYHRVACGIAHAQTPEVDDGA